MSVSDHRNQPQQTQQTQQSSFTRSSRKDQGISFAPSICGQQGFLCRRRGHGSWDRFWTVLNGNNLTFHPAPGVIFFHLFKVFFRSLAKILQ